MKENNNVGYKLRMLHNQLHKRMEYGEAELTDNLTRMQKFTIGFLSHNKGREIYQKDIEAEFSISRATASNMLAVMERKDLIRREMVRHDARLKKIVLTEKAEQQLREIDKGITETEALLTKGMTGDDVRKLHQYLDLMIQNIVSAEEETTTRCCGCEKKDTGKN